MVIRMLNYRHFKLSSPTPEESEAAQKIEDFAWVYPSRYRAELAVAALAKKLKEDGKSAVE